MDFRYSGFHTKDFREFLSTDSCLCTIHMDRSALEFVFIKNAGNISVSESVLFSEIISDACINLISFLW